MSAPVHLRVEVLYETLDGPVCGYQTRGRLTDDDSEVTCRKCLSLMGVEVEPLVEVEVLEPRDGRERRAA